MSEPISRLALPLAAGALATLTGCLTLDGFAFNPVHCSQISEATCEGASSIWNEMCTPCEETYPWDKEYDWIEGTLADGGAVRAIDPATVSSELVPSDDGAAELDLQFVPAHGEDPELAEVTIIYFHGNYGGTEHYLPRIRFLHEAGYNVLAWDYRGYGKSMPAETSSPAQLLEDAHPIWEAAQSYAVDPEKIVLYAYSLGAPPLVEMALSYGPCAIMLEAPFTSLSEVAQANTGLSMPEGFLSNGELETSSRLESYEGPLLTMIGTEDTWAPPDAVRAMHDGAPGPKRLWEVEGARHGVSDGGVPEGAGVVAYAAEMRSFLEDLAPGCLGQ